MLNDADSNFFKMESIRTERRESSNRKVLKTKIKYSSILKIFKSLKLNSFKIAESKC